MSDEPLSGVSGVGAPDAGPPPGPLVFISHDSRDADVAEAFSKLLATVSAGMLKSFRSSDRRGGQGFEYGVEWYPELMKRLDVASDVVCLLTERSLGRPWILYEAGVAKGKLNIPVHGLALGIPLGRATAGPFAQFQNCDDDGESITKLVEQLVRRLPNADPDHELVATQVEQFRTRVGDLLSGASAAREGAHDGDDASSAKLFEEIKVMFQDLPGRIETVVVRDDGAETRRGRLQPEFVVDMGYAMAGGDARSPLTLLAATSVIRHELPWLHELARAAYHAWLAQDREAFRRASADLTSASEICSFGSFERELLLSRDTRVLVSMLPALISRLDLPLDADSESTTEG